MPCVANARRGMTLVEVMVAAFLAALVLYVVLNLLIPAMRVSTVGTTRVDLDQRAALAGERLVRALKTTTRAGIGLAPVGDNTETLSIHPILGSMPDSKQSWSPFLTVFVWKEQSLREVRASLPTPPIQPTTLSPAELESALLGASPRFRIDGVTRFLVTLDSGPRADFQFTLEKGNQKLSVSRGVFLVNSQL